MCMCSTQSSLFKYCILNTSYLYVYICFQHVRVIYTQFVLHVMKKSTHIIYISYVRYLQSTLITGQIASAKPCTLVRWLFMISLDVGHASCRSCLPSERLDSMLVFNSCTKDAYRSSNLYVGRSLHYLTHLNTTHQQPQPFARIYCAKVVRSQFLPVSELHLLITTSPRVDECLGAKMLLVHIILVR